MQIVPDLQITANTSSVFVLYFFFSPQIIFNFHFLAFLFPPPWITEFRTEVTEANWGDIFTLNSDRENCRATSDKAKCISISIQFSFYWLEFHLFSFEWSSETWNTNAKWLISCVSAFLLSKVQRLLHSIRNCQLYLWRSAALWVANAWQIAQRPAESRHQQPLLGHQSLLHQDVLPGRWVLSPPSWFLLGSFYEAFSQLTVII